MPIVRPTHKKFVISAACQQMFALRHKKGAGRVGGNTYGINTMGLFSERLTEVSEGR